MARLILAAILVALLPAAGLAEPVRIAVISDMNGSYGSTSYAPRVDRAIERIVELAPDIVLSTGDMVAGQRRAPPLSAAELDAMWSAFHATVTRPLAEAGLPFAVTPGNHDASGYAAFARERARYAVEWTARRPAMRMVDEGSFPFAYAFETKGVLLVSLDATTVGGLPAAQMAWLDDLLTRTAGQYRATVVFSHLPLWPIAVGREREIIGDPALAALFRRTGVDLHLSGHHHAYYPGAAEGVLHVAQACLGGGPRALIGTGQRAPHAFTLVEIGEDGAISVRAYVAPDYREAIDHRSLPARIVTDAATLTRIDLAGPDD